ncbi:MAG: hypothetical protein GY725_03035 [bacterium]|nr:hypothetical protein [bacterium]
MSLIHLRFALVLLAVVAGTWTSSSISADTRTTRVLRGVTVAPGRDWTVIEIHMDVDLRLLSHAPVRLGRTLEIRMRRQLYQPSSPALRGGETVEWHERDLVGLVDVQLDADSAGNPKLLVHFDRPMEFEVSQGNALDRVQIAVRPAPLQEIQPVLIRPRPAGEADSVDQNRIDQIMSEARKAMTAGNFDRAILLFTKVIEQPEHSRAPEALELLGLAHQRNGQFAHARAEYARYLQIYDDIDGSARVRQRLQALLTLKSGRQPKAMARPTQETWSHSLSGSISQSYRRHDLDIDGNESETTSSSFDSDVFLSSRHVRPGLSLRTSYAASYRHDLLETLDTADALRITSGFIDLRWRESENSLRLGRQSASGGGVLGRFDGALFGFPMGERLRLNLVSGFPVDFTESNHLNASRPFYGLSIDSGSFADYWDGQLFAIQQWIDGVEGRTAVGGQLRFAHPQGFWLAMADYDVSYGVLNTAMLVGNWRLGDTTSINLLADLRASPVLTTLNALQGQTATSIDDLHDLFSADEIRQLAEDRTSRSRLVTIGATHRINQTWQVSGDVSLSRLSDTEASAGVDATEGTGNEVFYSLRGSASNLLVEGSFTSFDVRYADTSSGRRYSLGGSGRYPIVEGLRLGPQLIVERRENDSAANLWRYRPSIRADFRWKRLWLELELGIDITDGSANVSGSDQREYFSMVGYRYEF